MEPKRCNRCYAPYVFVIGTYQQPSCNCDTLPTPADTSNYYVGYSFIGAHDIDVTKDPRWYRLKQWVRDEAIFIYEELLADNNYQSLGVIMADLYKDHGNNIFEEGRGV
jgi:hypothetical protein